MKGWKAVVSIILIFLLGAMAGALVMHRVDQRKIESVMKGEAGTTREFIVTRLERELGLDSAQVEQLRMIIKETHAEMREVRKQYRPQIEDILKRSQERVRTILHNDQLASYNKMLEERKKRHWNEDRDRIK